MLKRGKGVQGAKAPVGGLRVSPPPRPSWSSGGVSFGGFFTARCGTIKTLTATPQAGKERFLRLFQTKDIYFITFEKSAVPPETSDG